MPDFSAPATRREGDALHEEDADIIAKARREISLLCAGRRRTTPSGERGREWTMCIPARPDDSDTIFGDVCRLAESLCSQLEQIRGERLTLARHIAAWDSSRETFALARRIVAEEGR